jgi:polysaccharide export outer membrane protein
MKFQSNLIAFHSAVLIILASFMKNITVASIQNSLCTFSLLLLLFTSCVSHKQLLLLDEGAPYINDSTSTIANLPSPIIQTDDRLFIKVSAFDAEASAPFNQAMLLNGNNNNNNQSGNNQANNGLMAGGANQNNQLMELMLGYLVDDSGNIEFPVVGTVQLGGLGLDQAKKKLYGFLDEYLVNYSVDIQFMNRRVTVSGEVTMPGLVTLDRNRISILEALQRSGGVTPYSNTKEIYVIREVDGERIFGNLDLHDRNIVNSQFYYVYPNDVVFVAPIAQKRYQINQAPVSRAISIVSSSLSALALILVLTR